MRLNLYLLVLAQRTDHGAALKVSHFFEFGFGQVPNFKTLMDANGLHFWCFIDEDALLLTTRLIDLSLF
jgi:hypothetical protein